MAQTTHIYFILPLFYQEVPSRSEISFTRETCKVAAIQHNKIQHIQYDIEKNHNKTEEQQSGPSRKTTTCLHHHALYEAL